MILSVSIMAVPERWRQTMYLYNQLQSQGIEPKIYIDYSYTGVWWNALRAWGKPDGEYHMVLQDDLELCGTFISNIFEIIKVLPKDAVVSFCHDNVDDHLIQKKIAKGLRWHLINSCRTAQSLMMSAENIYKWLAWDAKNIPYYPKAFDDARLAEWQLTFGIPLYLTIPELCHHIGLPSKACPGEKRIIRPSSLTDHVNVDWTKGLHQPIRKLPHHSLSHIRGPK